VHPLEMLTARTRDHSEAYPSPEFAQGRLDAVHNADTPAEQISVEPVPVVPKLLHRGRGDAVPFGEIENGPPLFQGNIDERGHRQIDADPPQHLARRPVIEHLRIDEDPVIVPENSSDHEFRTAPAVQHPKIGNPAKKARGPYIQRRIIDPRNQSLPYFLM